MTLSVKNDLLFRKCFASAKHPTVVKNFIKDVLELNIASIRIENPYSIEDYTNNNKKSAMRYTEVDVLVRLKDQRLINVELQKSPQDFYVARSIYYLASRYTNDYGRVEFQQAKTKDGSEKYSSLYPVYGINIVDFLLFSSDERMLHSFNFRDNDTFEQLEPSMLNLCYIELGKKPPEHLRHWIDFFNDKPISDDAPDYIKQAYKLVDYANLNEKERKMISAQERREQDIIGQRNYAVNKARAEVALNLLAKKMDPAEVAELTGLSIQKINELAHA